MALSKVTVVGLYNYDNTLFDNMQVPTGINKDDLIYNILERSGDLPLLYPDFAFMRAMIGVWSRNTYNVITKLLATITIEYNPIENFDRRGEIHRETRGASNSTNTNAQTAFDSVSFADTDRSTNNGEATGDETVTERIHGNIGVTTTQQMLEQERKIAVYNIYDVVTRDFINRFCIELY